MYWEREAECLDREDLEQIQLERLQSIVYRVYKNVPFYRKSFDALDLDPESIASLKDLRRLPFTTREDLVNNYPYGLFAVSLREIVRLHTSAGKTGRPIVIGYTKRDLKTQAQLSARILTACGVRREDIIQIAYNFGLNPQAFALQAGAELIGATVIPISTTETATKQWQIIQDYRTTVLASLPSFALRLADALEELDINPNSLTLRVGIFSGEPWDEGVRKDLENRLRIAAFDHYGLTEMMGHIVACECGHHQGLHVNEDHFLVEIIDPETLEPLPLGQTGELVITSLSKEAIPLIRYRTRDLTSLYIDQCPCGRSFIKMERVKGRTDEVIFVQGAKILPSELERILVEMLEISPQYQIVVEGKPSEEKIVVNLALPEKFFFDEMKEQTKFVEKLKERLSSELQVTVEVKLLERKYFDRVNVPKIVD